MADLDSDLSRRLSRLADAVPTSRTALDPVHRRAVEARQGVRMAWLTPLVALLIVVVAATLLGGGGLPSRTAEPSDSSASGHVVATTRSGEFELTIRANKMRYVAGEPIDISASLTYLGQAGPIEVGHVIGSDGNPIGFGVNESIFGGYHLSGGISRLVCHRTMLSSGEPVTKSFVKTGGGSGDAVGFGAYMRDPVFWLPPGVWHPYAMVQSSTDCVDGRHAVPDMRVEIELEVVDAPAEGPTQTTPPDDPIEATTRHGDFTLTIRSPRKRYAIDEPIDIQGTFAYAGEAPVQIVHSRAGSPLGFGIVEPILGDLILRPGGNLPCRATMLEAGYADTADFTKSGSWNTEDPLADEYEDFLQEPELRLSPGTWHVYAVAHFAVNECGDPIELRAEIEIVVGDEPPVYPTSPPAASEWSRTPVQPDGSVRGTGSDGTFELRLRAESETPFVANTPIDLFTAYVYLGPEPGIVVGHHAPEVGFSIEQFGVPITVNRQMLYDSMCAERELTLGIPASVGLTWANLMRITAGSLPGTFDAGLRDGYLLLPAGQWRITAHLLTDVGGCPADGEGSHNVLASIDIEVGSSTLAAVQLETAPAPVEACELPRHSGTLALDDETGLGIIIDSGHHPVRWPYGYTAWREGDNVVLHDAADESVAQAGQAVIFGGFTVEGDLLVLCGDVRGIVLVPGVDSDDVEIDLATHPVARLEDGTPVCNMALGSGVLALNPRTGLGFAPVLFGKATDVSWPEGFSARYRDGVATLFDESGGMLAEVGDRVTATGGYGLDDSFIACAVISVE